MMRNPLLRDCACRESPPRGRRQQRRGPSRGLRESPRRRPLREDVAPERHEEVEPVILEGGPGSTCRPFIVVQKDPERFAACNALADQVGEIDGPEKAFVFLEEAIGDEVNEVFGVMTLDLHKRMKGIAITGRGEPTSVMAPIAPTLQAAVVDGGQYAIIFHVHPSGIEAFPSDADVEVTESFVEAFDKIGIPLLDHIIVGGDVRDGSYYSFAEDNAL